VFSKYTRNISGERKKKRLNHPAKMSIEVVGRGDIGPKGGEKESPGLKEFGKESTSRKPN